MTRKILLSVLILSLFGGALATHAQQDETNQTLRRLQLRVKQHPEDAAGFAGLGAAYLQKGRETGDAADFESARSALEKSLDLLSNDPAAAFATTQMAIVCMAEHRFDDALTWAQKALALGAGDPSPWAIAGDALADMGDYTAAVDAYSKLESPFGSQDEKLAFSYQHDTRMSFLRFVSGDTQGAIDLMNSAVRTAIATHMPAENIAWTHYQLGEEFLQAGQVTAAGKAYVSSSSAVP